jgi:hypothetical protein
MDFNVWASSGAGRHDLLGEVPGAIPEDQHLSIEGK